MVYFVLNGFVRAAELVRQWVIVGGRFVLWGIVECLLMVLPRAWGLDLESNPEHSRVAVPEGDQIKQKLLGTHHPVSLGSYQIHHPFSRKPLSHRSVSQHPVSRHPASQPPVIRFPASHRTVSRRPVVGMSVSRRPAVLVSASRHPATQLSATDTPLAENPGTQQPVTGSRSPCNLSVRVPAMSFDQAPHQPRREVVTIHLQLNNNNKKTTNKQYYSVH